MIIWQGSSIGAYTTQWLNEFHWSARGETAEDWLDKSKKSREKLPFPSVKIVFPTRATVQASAGGEEVRPETLLVNCCSDRS
jgi:tyrosyl-DNA phosphodiesterase-1